MPREKPLIDGVELIEFTDRVQNSTIESTLTSCKPPSLRMKWLRFFSDKELMIMKDWSEIESRSKSMIEREIVIGKQADRSDYSERSKDEYSEEQ